MSVAPAFVTITVSPVPMLDAPSIVPLVTWIRPVPLGAVKLPPETVAHAGLAPAPKVLRYCPLVPAVRIDQPLAPR